MIFIQKVPDLEPKMRDALRVHIVRKRQRLKQELEQDAIEKRLKREKELKQLQDAMTLDQIKEQLSMLEKRLDTLKDEKHNLFVQLKQVLNEDNTRQKQHESEQQKKQDEKVVTDSASIQASASTNSNNNNSCGDVSNNSTTSSANSNDLCANQQTTALKPIITNKVQLESHTIPQMKQIQVHPKSNIKLSAHPRPTHNFLPRTASIPPYHSNTHPVIVSKSHPLTLIPPTYSMVPTNIPLSHQQVLSSKPTPTNADVHANAFRGTSMPILTSGGSIPPEYMTSNIQMNPYGQHARLPPHLVGNRTPMVVDMPLSLPKSHHDIQIPNFSGKRTLSVANMNDGAMNLDLERSLSHKKVNSNFMYSNQSFLLNGVPHQPITNLSHYSPLNPQSAGLVGTPMGPQVPSSTSASLIQNNQYHQRKPTPHQLATNYDYMLNQSSKSAGSIMPNMNAFYSTPTHLIPQNSLYNSSVENELAKHFTSPYATTLAAQHYGANTSRHQPPPTPQNNDPHYLGGVGLNYQRKFPTNPKNPHQSHK